jgi:hypothetical protein
MSEPTDKPKIDDGGPAFPHKDFVESHPGMSKREEYAKCIMSGIVSNPNAVGTWKHFASVSVLAADALIAELKK